MKMKKVWSILLLIFCIILGGCIPQPKPEEKEAEEAVIIEEKEPPKPVVKNASFAVVGDIMVHDYQYNEAYDKATGTYNFMHNFQDMKKYFEGYDMVIGNLETTFAGESRPISSYPMFNTPDSFLDAVKDAGFNLLTTANNHCMDTFESGLIRTLDKLDEAEIDHVGTYRSEEESKEILIKEVNGIKFAFLSYTYGTNGIYVPQKYLVNILSEEKVKDDIKKAKEKADMVVVLPHMGNEYETQPRQVFIDWADLMFESGADIILASHPHVLQPMEYRTIEEEDGTSRTGFIIYSLGNFISSQTTPPRNASIVLHMNIQQIDEEKPTITQVSFVPIWTQFRNAADQNHFVVRSVYDMLKLPEETRYDVMRKKDYQRVLEIQKETTMQLLGREIPVEEMQEEYIFPKP
jgi:poly-gamma-glutamate capsule biosynthesis protein CapA/YwtB (metallophosphatase superfamily)